MGNIDVEQCVRELRSDYRLAMRRRADPTREECLAEARKHLERLRKTFSLSSMAAMEQALYCVGIDSEKFVGKDEYEVLLKAASLKEAKADWEFIEKLQEARVSEGTRFDPEAFPMTIRAIMYNLRCAQVEPWEISVGLTWDRLGDLLDKYEIECAEHELGDEAENCYYDVLELDGWW